ncbi:MAG: PQQ-dependent sugar dehydrogenase [Ilyomonas sp.]
MKFFSSLMVVSIIVCASCNAGKGKDSTATTDSSANAVKLQLVTYDIPRPVAMKASPDHSHRLFISDLSGKIWIMKNGRLSEKPFIDIGNKLENKDSAMDMRAMFSMAFHPKFEENGKFYLCYNAPSKDSKNKCQIVVSEFHVSNTNPDSASLLTEKRVFALEENNVGVNNSEIEFGPDGYLYIAIGDHGELEQKDYEKEYAQKPNSLLGKILRIDVDKTPYAIPADNPFVNDKKCRPEIWASGFRRLWRFSFDPVTGQMIGGDVGDKMQEEVDIITKGGNYGWPVKEGDSMYLKNSSTDTSNFVKPINTYSHKDGICVIGGYVYHGNSLPFLNNKYVFADYNGNLFSLEKNTKEWLRKPLQIKNKPADTFLIFSCGMDDKNELYVMGALNEKTGLKGVIYKLTP